LIHFYKRYSPLEALKMGIIEDELSELKRCCEDKIPGSKVIAAVPAMIRVEIEKN